MYNIARHKTVCPAGYLSSDGGGFGRVRFTRLWTHVFITSRRTLIKDKGCTIFGQEDGKDTHVASYILARTTFTPTRGLCAYVRGAYNQYLRVFTKYYNINIKYSVVLILKRKKGKGQTASSRTRVTCTIRPPSPYTIITCKHGVCVCVVWAPDGSRPVSPKWAFN